MVKQQGQKYNFEEIKRQRNKIEKRRASENEGVVVVGEIPDMDRQKKHKTRPKLLDDTSNAITC